MTQRYAVKRNTDGSFDICRADGSPVCCGCTSKARAEHRALKLWTDHRHFSRSPYARNTPWSRFIDSPDMVDRACNALDIVARIVGVSLALVMLALSVGK